MNNSFVPSNAFEIKNSREFFNKLLDEYHDFDKAHLNARFAINCAITSWHLTDWTYQEFYADDKEYQTSIIERTSKNKNGITKFQEHLKLKCPELEYMRLITNGSKHCKINQTYNTIISDGDFNPYEFDRNEFDVPIFIIKNSKTNEEIDFEDALKKTIVFWETFLEKHYN